MAKSDKKEITIQDLPGVGAATAEKLKESGFDSLLTIAVATPGELVEASGVTEATARKIINVARDKLDMGFESGEDLLRKREQVLKISTGSKALDELFGGGIETGAVTEVFGAFGSGKTSLAHQLAVNVQLPKEKGGCEGMAVWIDSEGTLRPEFIKKLAEVKGIESSQSLKNFRGVRAFNSDHQMLLAAKVEDLIKKELPVKLVIVDSMMSHFRSEFSGRGMLANRQQKLNKHVHTLLKLATQYNLAVYITNQVMAKPDTFFGDPTEAVGGHVLHHACLTADTLIQLADGTILPLGDFYKPTPLTTIDLAGNLQQSNGVCTRGSIRNDISYVYEIDTTFTIKASPKHKFFKIEDFSIVEVEAQDLKVEDYVLVANKLHIDGQEQFLPDVKVKEMITFTEEASKIVKENFERNGITRKEICKNLSITPRQLRRALNQGYPTNKENVFLLIQQGVDGNLLELCDTYTSYKHRQIVIPQTLTPEIAQILGYLLGDGNIDKNSVSFKDQRIEVLQVYSDLFFNQFNIYGHISKVKDKNCYELDVNSVHLVDLFEQLREKTFYYISKSSDEHVKSFIKGFVDAEGCVSKKRPQLSIGQKDRLVLQYIQMLFSRLGVRATLDKSKKRDRDFFTLRLDGRDFLAYSQIGISASDKKYYLEKWIKYMRVMKFDREYIPVKREALWKLLKECGVFPSHYMKPRPRSYQYLNRKNFTTVVNTLTRLDVKDPLLLKKIDFLKSLLHNTVRFERVRRIKMKENKEPLYDLSVFPTENYIANGFIVHNSTYRVYLRRGKKGTRVAKLVDAPAMPENEAIFKVTDKGIEDVGKGDI